MDGWRRLRLDGRRHWRTIGLSVGYWGSDILCLLMVMLAFHQWVPIYHVLIAYAIAYVVGTVSPTPGGLGAVEGVMMAMLVSFGMESAAAVAVVLVYRLINFWLPIPFGLLSSPPAPRLARAAAGLAPARRRRGRCGTVEPSSAGSRLGEAAIKKTLRHILVFAVIVLALYLLLPRLVDTEGTVAMLTKASWVLLALAIALEVGALLGYANLTRYILKVLDIPMRLRDVAAITLSSLAVSHILSAGGVGGWVVTYNALRKRQAPHGLIFVAIAAQQFFNYVVLWFVFAMALLWLVIVRRRVDRRLRGRHRADRPHPVAHRLRRVPVQPPHPCGACASRRSLTWSTASPAGRPSRRATSTAGSTTCSSACAA